MTDVDWQKRLARIIEPREAVWEGFSFDEHVRERAYKKADAIIAEILEPALSAQAQEIAELRGKVEGLRDGKGPCTMDLTWAEAVDAIQADKREMEDRLLEAEKALELADAKIVGMFSLIAGGNTGAGARFAAAEPDVQTIRAILAKLREAKDG